MIALLPPLGQDVCGYPGSWGGAPADPNLNWGGLGYRWCSASFQQFWYIFVTLVAAGAVLPQLPEVVWNAACADRTYCPQILENWALSFQCCETILQSWVRCRWRFKKERDAPNSSGMSSLFPGVSLIS